MDEKSKRCICSTSKSTGPPPVCVQIYIFIKFKKRKLIEIINIIYLNTSAIRLFSDSRVSITPQLVVDGLSSITLKSPSIAETVLGGSTILRLREGGLGVQLWLFLPLADENFWSHSSQGYLENKLFKNVGKF